MDAHEIAALLDGCERGLADLAGLLELRQGVPPDALRLFERVSDAPGLLASPSQHFFLRPELPVDHFDHVLGWSVSLKGSALRTH